MESADVAEKMTGKLTSKTREIPLEWTPAILFQALRIPESSVQKSRRKFNFEKSSRKICTVTLKSETQWYQTLEKQNGGKNDTKNDVWTEALWSTIHMQYRQMDTLMNGGCLSRHRVGALTGSTDRKQRLYAYD